MNKMSYDDTSFYGDMITEEYDIQNNFMNPPSPFGFFIYHVVGGTFDTMDELINQFINDTSVLTCNDKLLEVYGRYWNLKRPVINGRILSDEEYRIYLYLQKCRLITLQDLEICFNNCMSFEDFDVRISVLSINKLSVVDHQNYESSSDNVVSDISANSDDFGLDKITDYNNDSEVNSFSGRINRGVDLAVVVEVPFNNWSSDFLRLLESFISVKGNVLVREYGL